MIVILAIALVIGVFSLTPWILMLVLGALAHMFAAPTLAVGFWACVLIAILLSIIGGFFSRN